MINKLAVTRTPTAEGVAARKESRVSNSEKVGNFYDHSFAGRQKGATQGNAISPVPKQQPHQQRHHNCPQHTALAFDDVGGGAQESSTGAVDFPEGEV